MRAAAVLATILLFVAPTLADADCVSARIESAFQLPDGSLHPAGTLELCSRGDFSPVLHTHEIYVDGGAVGLFLSRSRSSEVPVEGRPVIAFARREDGVLALVRYFSPLGGESNVYSFRIRPRGEAPIMAEHGSETLLIAAGPRPPQPSSQ